jgi:hypothetical protein
MRRKQLGLPVVSGMSFYNETNGLISTHADHRHDRTGGAGETDDFLV